MSKFSVQIQNYQIIESAKLDFEEGLTIIVGPSSNGKTSILRAIESAIFNKAGNSFIKQGESATAVGIKNDEHTVVWKKSADAGMYKVDGQVYNKIGRGQLVEVAKALGMSEIDVNGDKVRVNFLRQMEYPFLLDKNGTQLFEFLAMSNDNDCLAEIHQSMRSDIRGTNSSIDSLVGKIDAYKEVIQNDEVQLKAFHDIESVIDNIISYDSVVQHYENLENLVREAQNYRDSLLRLKPKILSLRETKANTEQILSCIDLDKVLGLQTLIEDIQRRLSEINEKEHSVQSIKAQQEQYQKALESISIDDLIQKQKSLENLKRTSQEIQDLIDNMNVIQSTISDLKSEYHRVEEVLGQFTVCPLCGYPLDTDGHNH